MDDFTVKIIIESKMAYLPLLRKTIRGLCSAVIQNEQIFEDIELSLNEALSNVIYHAYQEETGHEIQIVVMLYSSEIVLKIIDLGLKNPKITGISTLGLDLSDLDALPESGRGLFLIHQLMDEVTYKNEKDKNILILRKRFN